MNKQRKDTNLITTTAIKTLKIEGETILNLTDAINDTFVAAVQHISQKEGRLVVTGIGKSAIVAQKIVATFNSTGTPAIFMHAADAIHGDIGMIQPSDSVICISKSGETPEVKVLVPLIRNLGNTILAFSSNEKSYLAKRADYSIYIPVAQEADPNNLAPTASAVAQMAMGDAFATALLSLRGFTTEDFAQYHPGGALGKSLYLRVNDLYPDNAKPQVYEHSSLKETIVEMTSKRLGVTAVLDKAQSLIGIITDGDLRRMLEKGGNIDRFVAADIMTPNPRAIDASELAVEALHVMRTHSITQLMVVDQDAYVGIIHLHDLIREGII
jgi:arabinose-5-phosphate isomerase